MAVMQLFIACESNKKDIELQKPNTDNEEMKIAEVKFSNSSDIDTAFSPPLPDPEKKQKDQQKEQQQKQPVVNPDWDKKIIKTSTLNLEVKNYNVYYAQLREKVKNAGGYIAQEEQTQSDYKIENSLVIKVPVEQFENALYQLTEKVEKINEKKITSQDVTTEFIDVKSRLESKKQVRLRYIELLKQAKNMEEILNVQSEINSIQEEMESAAGRIEYLGHSSSFSTINLTYYEVLNSSAKDYDKTSFGRKIGTAFKTGLEWVGDLFVGLISIWPLFLVTFFAYILFRRLKLKKQ